ncbi:MAG: hypothetical protein CO108_31060 [Deltaproteobacteria bacterium CG_4_9_14_3_um_filter_63_12]|nr:MAG: hypothetical protein CO108_31060 [Deltaproteobacteria bacterium CG_4_9_14_3_um_filter_63_12]
MRGGVQSDGERADAVGVGGFAGGGGWGGVRGGARGGDEHGGGGGVGAGVGESGEWGLGVEVSVGPDVVCGSEPAT